MILSSTNLSRQFGVSAMSWKDLLSKSLAARRAWSLAGRLKAWYTLTSLFLILCTIALLYWALIANMTRADDLFLSDKVHVLRSILLYRPTAIYEHQAKVIL